MRGSRAAEQRLHTKLHVPQGGRRPTCRLCRLEDGPPLQRKLILGEREIAALEQFVQRVETLVAFTRDMLGGKTEAR